jgi:hypothetical protein
MYSEHKKKGAYTEQGGSALWSRGARLESGQDADYPH